MNNEIKEILIKDFNEILVKEFCTDWKEKRLYIELLVNSTPFSNLLDYIRNLQEENKELKAKLEMYENGVYFSSENDKLQERIDNACNYLKQQGYKKQ